jgi:hypothetical protein
MSSGLGPRRDLAGNDMDAIERGAREHAAELPASGDCELCGHWDSRLNGGICEECRKRLGIQGAFAVPELEHPVGPAGPHKSVGAAAATPPGRRQRCKLPCNEYAFWQLQLASVALQDLDHSHCAVTRIELTGNGPTLYLQQPPAEGVVASIHELVHSELGGERVKIARARFQGCTLEWRLL